MDTTLNEKLERINEIKRQKNFYDQLFSLFEPILAEREAFQKRQDFPDFSVDRQRVETNLSKNIPYIDADFFKLVKTPAEVYFKTVFEKISEKLGENAKAIEETLVTNSSGFQKFFTRDIHAVSDEFGCDPRLVVFLIRQCRKPFLEVLREKYTEFYDGGKWHASVCPVCGSLPFIEEIREENGKRFACCLDCGMQWALKQILCPYCRCTDQQKLGYFSSETEPFYMVSFCVACKYYIKSLDFRELTKTVIPEVEHIATLHLDIVAKKEGFKTADGFVSFIIG